MNLSLQVTVIVEWCCNMGTLGLETVESFLFKILFEKSLSNSVKAAKS